MPDPSATERDLQRGIGEPIAIVTAALQDIFSQPGQPSSDENLDYHMGAPRVRVSEAWGAALFASLLALQGNAPSEGDVETDIAQLIVRLRDSHEETFIQFLAHYHDIDTDYPDE